MAVFFISNVAARGAVDNLTARVDTGGAGSLRIYSGTAPADADAALSGNTLLAQLTFSATAFGAATDLNPGARATANAISDDTSADATGTATFFRILSGAGTVIAQGDVTASGGGGSMQLNTTSIVASALVSCTSMTITLPES